MGKQAERRSLPGHTPLFTVKLEVEDHEVNISPSAEELEQVLQKAISGMLQSVHEFTTVDPELMSLLQLEPKIIYDLSMPPASLGSVAQNLAKTRGEVTQEVQRSMSKAVKMAEKFSTMSWIMPLDTSQYVREIVKKEQDEIDAAKKAAEEEENGG